MKRYAVLLALAGCNRVFGIDETTLAPVSDAAINCATMPGDPGFHDEDDDDYADVCDNCLGVANQDQRDADGDAIGDACDPQPGKLDTVLRAFAFDDPAGASEWSPASGLWPIRDDAMHTDSRASGSEEDQLYRAATFGAPLAVEAGVTVDVVGVEPFSYKLGIEALSDAAGDTAYECLFARRWNGFAHNDEIVAYAPLDSETAPLVGSQLADGARYRLLLRLDSASISCRVDGEAGDGGTVTNELATFSPRMDHVGLLSESMVARYRYLVIYQLGS